MKMNELQTPYKRVKTISYGTGSKHNDPVYHWKELQQIGDSLYKDKEFDDKYNGKECCLYLMYAEADLNKSNIFHKVSRDSLYYTDVEKMLNTLGYKIKICKKSINGVD